MDATQSVASPFTAGDIARGFVAGALGVLVFQFGLSAILYAAGLFPNQPYSMNPVPPFGVPQVVSFAFWGGLWGIVLALILRNAQSEAAYWLTAILFGGIIVSAVLLFIVFPLKGRPIAAGWDVNALARIFTVHAVFGLGTAVFLRFLSKPRALKRDDHKN
jgi:hypothetical protein